MSRKIEEYLSEVSHYIAEPGKASDIIQEIRSHIADKASEAYSEASEENMEKVLAGMPPAREMAATFSQDKDIIAPYYRKHIIVYTAFLFAISLGVSVASAVLGKGIQLIPFLSTSPSGVLELFTGLPAAFFFYFGVVCLFFMVLTKYRQVKPAWLGGAFESAGKEFGKPSLAGLGGRLIGFLVVVMVLSFQKEIAEAISQLGNLTVFYLPQLLTNAFLALAGIDLAVYVMRFLANTPVLEAAGAAFKLIVLAFIVRMPLGFESLDGLSGTLAAGIEVGIRTVIVIVVVITTIELIRWLMYSFSEKYLK